MSLTLEKKQEVFLKYSPSKSKTDTGSAESQIALFTTRIADITEHLKVNKKDFATKNGLLKLVGHRRKLLGYLQKTNLSRYRAIIAALELRR